MAETCFLVQTCPTNIADHSETHRPPSNNQFVAPLVSCQFPAPPQQDSRSKDQEAAEDDEEPRAGAAGIREGCTQSTVPEYS